MALIRRLPEGPLDIIGDVHGELAALHELLARLGYDAEGRHLEGRRLVFVGDLCDRGPDSPGVFALVRRIVDSGRGDCILGNHELNLLRLSPKLGNGWFFPEEDDHDLKLGQFTDCRRLLQEERAALLQFIGGLPLALEREDLRIVHACWNAETIAALRSEATDELLRIDRDSERHYADRMAGADFLALAEAEEQAFSAMATDRGRQPPPAPNYARCDELYQNGNPVRVATSGMERVAAQPFFSTGKWRLLERVRWWEEYTDGVAVVFGHYWRVPDGMERPRHKDIMNPFERYAEGDWFGPQARAFCVDYCIGARFLERERGVTTGFLTRLGALRWPEAVLLMDNGRMVQTTPGSRGAAAL